MPGDGVSDLAELREVMAKYSADDITKMEMTAEYFRLWHKVIIASPVLKMWYFSFKPHTMHFIRTEEILLNVHPPGLAEHVKCKILGDNLY